MQIEDLFHMDRLTLLMMALVGFVALVVSSFSLRYLDGSSQKKTFFSYLLLLVVAVFVMVSADNLILFLFSWVIANGILARLMVYKKQWQAARESAKLALKNFAFGFVAIVFAAGILYGQVHSFSIQHILQAPIALNWLLIAGFFLLIAAMCQSAIWPFHRWLTSSLNSPTPVSAMMHAGLVNGGGFLLARFAPLFFKHPPLLWLIFAVGLITALLGTLWKLMQTDIKRMLACSTMGQMGFMVLQCGLGLFPAAIAHLCWHGLFKGYLFLGSGSAAKEKRLQPVSPKMRQFVLALLIGLLAAMGFSLISQHGLYVNDTRLFLVVIAWVAAAQFILPIVCGQSKWRFLLAVSVSTAVGLFYGLSVHLAEAWVAPLAINHPQPLNALYVIGLFVFLVSWVLMVFHQQILSHKMRSAFMLKQYVRMLNASQPQAKTMTTHRNDYRY